MLIDAIDFIDEFDKLCDLLVPLLILAHLCFADLHILEVILHAFSVLLPQLDGQVGRASLIGFQPIEVILLLGPQGSTNVHNLKG